ncbi:carbamoyl phosphate synthase small subunit [Isachenkonia alkalipeptolytica]|uniref:Carbamoyl phosphate synthase small chain n=1 Tax=Isachenkonia alkalipeptolytica TaxID=2565777 RepID=A0AA43XJZ1_9CLOT|nr:carbamoyl phosphate synthase small subunit [Isachenkonia alkalipeptolytica]NBG87766.1 glutamine-hydrolyzing carbamoyl-phosphate synthase small subunit [Isachenkonia alkalipeptolytica]
MKAKLVLEDGKTYQGEFIGREKEVLGEVVFNTGMNGYQELMTDPSYTNQIVVMTYPEIGNYGFNGEDVESKAPKVQALIVKELCTHPSNYRSLGGLEEYMDNHRIAGIKGVDTRSLTRYIRAKGSMRGRILPQWDPANREKGETENRTIKMENPVDSVTTKRSYALGEASGVPIAVMDFGIKKGILKELVKRGFRITVYPARTQAQEILSKRPGGILLSNGPGNPKDLVDVIPEMKKLIDSKTPIMGICLGHQLLNLAYGGDTIKLPFGHRGGNHPVKDLETGKVRITSQNHSYTVDAQKVPKNMKVTHINLNDGSVEGLCHQTDPVFSVQYHPEASPGPMDSQELFDQFYGMTEKSGVMGCL